MSMRALVSSLMPLAFAALPAAVGAGTVSPIARAALGQQNLVYNVLNQTAADVLYFPSDLARDPGRANTRVFVADTLNSRVVGIECATSGCALPNGATAVRVFGQPDFTSWASNGGVGSAPGATTLSFPSGVAVGPDGTLYVADRGNNRVLVYLDPWNDRTADRVLGQATLSSVTAGSGRAQLRAPEGVAVDAAGTVWVADTGNNRVLGFTTVVSGATASIVLGGSGGPSAGTMSGPRGLALAPSGHLYVADTGFSRVLRFGAGAADGAPAQAALGQGGSLTSGVANLGGLGAASMGFPEKLHVDGTGRLWVADTGNRRVLQFDAPLSGGAAQRVYGQSNRSQVPTFTTNALDAPDGFPNASGFAGPRGLLVDGGGRLWVADRDNSRVLGFDAPVHALGDTAAAKAAVVADRILGETSFTDSAVNRASAQRVNNPFALAVDRSATPNRLWVVDIGNNRVLGYNSTADLVSDRAADLVLGQPGLTDSDTNAGINGPLQNAATAVASASSLFFPSGVAVDSLGGVYVADASNSRILHFLDPFATNRTADRVFGQESFTARNPDYPYGTASSLAGPHAVDLDETDALWVADTLYHRVVRFAHAPSQPATGASANLVLGQSSFVSSTTFPPAAYTSGCSATKLNQPFGVHAGAGGRIYVADRGNHRVLVFQAPFGNGEAAVAVFGQAGFTACAANRGGAPSAATLNAPWNAYEDEVGDVYIADYGNNRVLVYRTPFAGGDFVADEVIGQPNLTSVALASSPGPDTLSSPAGIDADAAGRVFVADSENSRTLRYDGGVGVGGPLLDPLPSPVVVGGFLTVTGAGFTNGSVIKLFVATPSGVVAHGPYTPDTRTPGFLITNLPPTIPLGSGFVSVQVINTDQGFLASAAQSQWLFGSAAFGLPTITAVNGTGLPAPDPALPTAYIETSLAQGSTATITGTGFSTPLVNLFTAAGNLGPLTPLPGGTSTQIRVVVPAGAPTGPGSFQVVNAPYTGTVTSNAVSVVIGARLSIGSVSQAGSTVTVNGTGFSVLTVVNLFNRQGGGAVNLGGLTAAGAARIPLAFVNATRVTFTVPAGAVSGPAFVEALNPPFVPYTSSGTDPDGAFALTAAPPAAIAVDGGVVRPIARGARDRVAAEGAVATSPPRASGEAAWAAAERPAGVPLSWMPRPVDARLVRAHESLVAAHGRLDLAVPERGDLLIGFSDGGGAGRTSGIAFGWEIRGTSRDLVLLDNGETAPIGPVAPGEALSIRALPTHVEFWWGDRLVGRSRGAPSFPLLVEAGPSAAAAAAGARLAGPLGRTVIWKAREAGDAPAGPPGHDRVRDGGRLERGAAVLAELDDSVAIGLAGLGGEACAVCVSSDGRNVQVWSDGRLRGRWPSGPRTIVALEPDTSRGLVRILADGAWIDEVPLDSRAFATLGLYEWRAGRAVGGRRAVVSADRQVRSTGGQK